MISEAITTTVLTHPLQVLLIATILARLAREVLAAAARGRRAPRDPSGSPVRSGSDLQAA
jgi:hypothetical protein